MIEISDLYMEGEMRWGVLEEIARVVIQRRGWAIEEGVKRLERNFESFVDGKGG